MGFLIDWIAIVYVTFPIFLSITTELGLIVAIPCLLFGSLLNGWADRLKDDMEKAALRSCQIHGFPW